MGTTYTVKVAAAPADVTRGRLQAEVEAILARINRVFSTYQDNSEISRFNQANSTDWWPVSGEVITVIEVAQAMGRLSGGAFDVTAAPLVSLWGFGPRLEEPRVPSATEITSERRRTGYRKLRYRRQPAALRKTVGDLRLDLNALVAGYAADQVALRFEQIGVHNYLVDMGGEFRLGGRNDRGTAWSVAVELPLPDHSKIGRVLALTDCAVSTSGNYRNFFEAGGRQISHVLDARSGRPIEHAPVSVTVIAPTAMQADVWATTLLILGEKEGLRLAAREQVAALFISRHAAGFEEKASSTFSAYAGSRLE